VGLGDHVPCVTFTCSGRDVHDDGIHTPIQEVILDFEDLFQAPTALPPFRTFDHIISLLSDIVPINCMPYRYSPQQKTEIERQVTNMLQLGIVIPASTLLLPLY
jgi:hypothetical protein